MKPSDFHAHRILTGIGILLMAGSAFAASNFTNYRSVIRVNDIIEYNNKIWAASSGGLVCIDMKNSTQTITNSINQFPDLNLTALCVDSLGNLWIASSSGYICKQTRTGHITLYNSYYGSGWDILDILALGKYLLIASKKGFSIFDPGNGVALRNATAIDTISNDPRVNTIAIHNDSLYLGCKGGFAVLDIAGSKLLSNNYYDKSIWHMTATNGSVVSFTNSNGILKPCTAPSATYNNTFVTTDTSMTIVTTDTSAPLCTLPSSILTMYTDHGSNLWLGTTENYLFRKNISGLTQYTIAGPTISDINRVWAAKNGTLWLIPPIATSNAPWWQGIVSYDGKSWKLYNPSTTANFGEFEGGTDFHGICETRDSTMWFGAWGPPIKRYMPLTNTWKRYYIDGFACCANEIRELNPSEINNFWGKHDAIAQDSSGILWFGCYTNSMIVNSLVCYNPSTTATPNFKRFFPTTDSRHMANVRSLCVDSKGKIIAGSDDGRLIIFSHNGNPFVDSVSQSYVDKNDLSNIPDISASPGGTTWIVTSKGLYSYVSGEDSLRFISDTATFTSVEAESDSVVWLGTQDSGLIRYSASNGEMTTIGVSKGLISNTVTDLSLDRKNGFLWVATHEGLSRFALGHSFSPITGNTSIVAYPNPYSLSNPNHREVVFKHCTKNAAINIYAMNGSLVKTLTPDANSAYTLTSNQFETTLSWTPPKNIAPGTYFFAGLKPYSTKKIIIIP